MDQEVKDHKQLGQELELFFTNEIAPGAPFWLPKGMVIFKELEEYIRELTENAGYLETSTPIMVKSDLFIKSGHWTKFGAHNMYNLSLWEEEEIKHIGKFLDENEALKKMIEEKQEPKYPFFFTTMFNQQNVTIVILGRDEKQGFIFDLPVNYSLKPMNCPESTILYIFRPRTYKKLPLRLSEIGRLHRREKSGEVNGLLRVRQLTMDDAHIYATEEQIFEEVGNILDMMMNFYKLFGFSVEFKLATRPELRAGSDEMWDKAEKDLAEVLKQKGIKAGDKMGDGAFYGPKIDVHIKDSLGREWQLATVQLDFHQPAAFELKYIDKDGSEKRPVMIHRAILGSFERFIGILTEHYQGKFPLWLSPVQVVIIPIADRHSEHAEKVEEKLKDKGIRVEVDSRSETMQAKIRDATLQKVPILGIIGDKEIADDAISVRRRDSKEQKVITLSDFVKSIQEEIDKKT